LGGVVTDGDGSEGVTSSGSAERNRKGTESEKERGGREEGRGVRGNGRAGGVFR